MLYALSTMSPHHLTCLQLWGMVCSACRKAQKALLTPVNGRGERVKSYLSFFRLELD